MTVQTFFENWEIAKELYDVVDSGTARKIERKTKTHKIQCYRLTDFGIIRLDIKPLHSNKPYTPKEERAILEDAKRGMFGDDANLVSDNMGAQ